MFLVPFLSQDPWIFQNGAIVLINVKLQHIPDVMVCFHP